MAAPVIRWTAGGAHVLVVIDMVGISRILYVYVATIRQRLVMAIGCLLLIVVRTWLSWRGILHSLRVQMLVMRVLIRSMIVHEMRRWIRM